ncbi:AAA family ATPase [Flavobacterium enshiense]|uniref:ATP-dependent nuclease n=1 Tax=Flavobacterium enshiense TaxID=1341165 RepID=UPI00345DF987
MIKKIHIQNFKSIIDTTVEINNNIFVLAGQNEAGKSSILDALEAFEKESDLQENLNFEEENKGNLVQKISITYTVPNADFYEELEKECRELAVDQYKSIDFESSPILDIEKLKKIKEYTLTRVFDYSKNGTITRLEIDEFTQRILKVAINTEKKILQDVNHKTVAHQIPYLKIEEKINDIAKEIWRLSPIIKLFNDFADLLPDNILVSDLERENKTAKGYNAVKKFETLLKQDFVGLSKKAHAQKKSSIQDETKHISATFQSDWKQKINDAGEIKVIFDIDNNDSGQPTIRFYLESKEGVLLEPRKRSKGMIWFLSLWLELKNSENNENMVLLFDEPGLHLHVKANNDMLNVFKRLKEKGHQIIYSTHLPSLIETDNLHNIGLVLNTPEKGTIVEGLTTSKLDTSNKKDALQPVAEAMGLTPLKDFSILSEKNVLLEGLSDFWYFQGMSKILGKKVDYKFVPGVGIKSSKMFPLISFCIGYGLDWILVMDNGENPINTREELKENLFNSDEKLTDEKVKLINFKEVEDMFNSNDFLLVDNKFNVKSGKIPSEIIGTRKIIYAKLFYQNVIDKKITKSKLDKQTVKNFENVFDFIDQSFSKNAQTIKVPQKNIVKIEEMN